MVTSPFKGSNGSNRYFKDIAFAAVRTQLGNLDLAADRYLNVPTTPMYLKYAKEHKFSPDSIMLPSGAQAHWFGSSSAKKVLVYFHGKLEHRVALFTPLIMASRWRICTSLWSGTHALAG